MAFRSSKSKKKLKQKSIEDNSKELTLVAQSENQFDDQQTLDVINLQNQIADKERLLNTLINHNIIVLDANIDDIKTSIDQKRPEQKIYKSSICDLWLRLKTLEQMGPVSFVTYLRTNQLHRPYKQFSDIDDDLIENPRSFLTNPRHSRLIHFHIYNESDEYNMDIDSYVGLLIFSYDNQSKFILNGHYCQRGDILIKQMNFFSQTQKIHRGIYDSLFKWYFDRFLDERFFGAGFIYVNKKWRFDLITCDDRDFFPYEYRLFDMYLLTHWLTKLNLSKNIQEMEIDAKNLLMEQYVLVKKRINDQETNELFNNWDEFIGSDIEDLRLSIEKFHQTIDAEIELIFKQSSTFSALFKQNN